MIIISELPYSLHLGSNKNRKNSIRSSAKNNISGTTSMTNNGIQNAKTLSKCDKHNYRKYDNEQEQIVIVKGTSSLYKDVEDFYKTEFEEARLEYNNKQKRDDRKIDDYFKKVSDNSKSDLACEIIIELGDKKFWDTKDLELMFKSDKHSKLELKCYNGKIIDNLSFELLNKKIKEYRDKMLKYLTDESKKAIELTSNKFDFSNNDFLISKEPIILKEDVKEHLKIAKENKVNIIRTKNDSFTTSKLISLASSISSIMSEDKSKVFKENDYYYEFIDASKKLKHNNYPVLNNNNECLGLIRITEIAKKNNKKVILVDHQEKEQSVTGLDEANILEIVDHHKIGNINTNNPINFRNMTVGSTNTIIYFMYEENNIEIPKNIAGLMLSGILSDTLCLQSPTTTEVDKKVVESLSKLAEVDYEKYAIDMFKAGTSLEGMTKEEVIKSDFKSFPVGDIKVAIGQVFTLDIDRIFDELDSYIETLNETNKKEGYEFTIIAITDILKNGSYLIYTENAKKVLENAYNIEDIKQGYYVDGLVSRKKQLLPLVLNELN